MSAPATPLPRTDHDDLPDFKRFEARLHAVGGKSRRTAATYATHARLYTDWLTTTRPELSLLDADRDIIEDYIIDLAEQVRPPAHPKPTTTDYSSADLDRLLATPLERAADAHQQQDQRRWVRARFDHAVLCTFRYSGVRLGELLSLRPDDVDLPRRQLQVHGKGAKQRYVPIPQQLADTLSGHLNAIRPHCPPSDRLFANPNCLPGTAVYGQLAQRAAFDIVHRHATAAGLTGHHHPHRLRHSYATEVLRLGATLEEIRQLLGHSEITTTVRYLHLSKIDLANTIDRAYHRQLTPNFTDRSDQNPATAA